MYGCRRLVSAQLGIEPYRRPNSVVVQSLYCQVTAPRTRLRCSKFCMWSRQLIRGVSKRSCVSEPRMCEYASCVSKVPQRSVLIRRSEEHTSELQSLMRISYAVFCLKK